MSLKLKLIFQNIASFQINYWWLVIIAMLIHRLPFWMYNPSEAMTLKKVAMFISYLVLIFVISRNWKTFAFRLIMVGVLLNFAAVAFNGGLMPVTPEARLNAGMSSIEQAVIGEVLPEGSGILLTKVQTNLWLFTDIIPIEKLGAVCSIGDIIILGGMIVLIIQIVYQSYKCTVSKNLNIGFNKIVRESEKT
jgi:hypothetical protein